MYIIYIYIYREREKEILYPWFPGGALEPVDELADAHPSVLGTKDCTPEIDTSEVIVDVQYCPTDVSGILTDLHLSVVCSKGLSLPQRILLEMFNGHSLKLSNGISLLRVLACNIRIYIYIYIYITCNIYIYIYIYISCIPIYIYIYVCMYAYMCIHIYIYIYVYHLYPDVLVDVDVAQEAVDLKLFQSMTLDTKYDYATILCNAICYDMP